LHHDLRRASLEVLQAGEFLYEQPTMGDVEFRFKHTLTRDEAYKSLLTERRKLLHERTAQAVETLYARRLEDQYAELAHHFRLSDNAPKAIEYLLLAGGQAADRGSYAQSGENAELALKLIERLPQGVDRLRAELGVRLMEGMTVTALHGLASTERVQTFERVCQLSEQLGDRPTLFRGLLNLGFAHGQRFEALRALEISRRCVKLAEQGMSEMLPAAQGMLAQILFRLGDLIQAASVGIDAMRSFISPDQPATSLVSANLWATVPLTPAMTSLTLGKPDEALKFGDEGLRRARELKHALSVGLALHIACLLRYERREPSAAREQAEASIALADEHGFREFSISGRALRAWAMCELDQTEQGIAELEASVAPVQGLLMVSKSVVLAHAYLRAGRAKESLVVLDEELAAIEQSGAYVYAAELRRLKGEAILMHNPSATAEAEGCFRKAIEIARGQSAKWWELRATTSLARLLRDTQRHDEARDALANIYNWFTEGFDTADLKDAKALLDEMSA
jgi:tetratricopeptide (TPR) repeat protein